METIKYNGENVYTQSSRNVRKEDLVGAIKREGSISEAYFFELYRDDKSGFRHAKRVGFDRAKIKTEKSGLCVVVQNPFGDASLYIAGLDRIVGFLCDSEALGDLSVLKGKKVTIYDTPAYEHPHLDLVLGAGLLEYKTREEMKNDR